jgi:sulfoxide reductase catalytic subunit YedY
MVRAMMIRKPADIPYSQVTPRDLYLNRRRFLAGGSAALGALAAPFTARATKLDTRKSPFSTTEKLTSLQDITHYNNYYEFGTGKEEPAEYAKNWHPQPDWTISIEGEVTKPKTLSLDSVLKLAPLEERIYRHRCVERWSIVVPWIGFSLSELLKQVEPTSKAKYVAFQTYYDPKQMPQSKYAGIPLPYVEGLRMDEAMHPLALLCVGLYGETLPNQNGAPLRIVIPWKYGFKSIKSIVKVRFVEKQPPTTWNISAANEYGFYSNVNPERDHPRWSQKRERRLGVDFFSDRATLKFNGYGEQVAGLYAGMDLIKNY